MKPSNLKRLRLNLDLTIGRCADDMHVSRQTLYNIENGTVCKDSTMLLYELYLKEIKRQRDYAHMKREEAHV